VNWNKLACLVAGVLALAVSGRLVKADEVKKEESKPAARAEALTHETLKTMLENLGYKPQTIKSTRGSPMYKFAFDRASWSFTLYVSQSEDKKNVWMSSYLGGLPEPAKLRADILEKILAKNFDIGPMHFVVKSPRRLYLELPLANKGITAGQMREQIEEFTVTIKSTETLWNPEKYPPLPKAEEKKPDATPKEEKK
jgi:hypothetical protein